MTSLNAFTLPPGVPDQIADYLQSLISSPASGSPRRV